MPCADAAADIYNLKMYPQLWLEYDRLDRKRNLDNFILYVLNAGLHKRIFENTLTDLLLHIIINSRFVGV